ncbi:hypothetical protein AXF42_Ash008271 [Apostasia shenzhenica]|uniref:Protein ZIP4 homolog n=1 Tax=Apostasia shenzhenica TaxID=1088818 RepID=A0A2I0AXD8_9ASPA|nr:hypothetical protein AXF42_Ash008271 [Apostasia shenzhenica]
MFIFLFENNEAVSIFHFPANELPPMRISELSPELRCPATSGDLQPSHLHFLEDLESSVNEAESLSPEDPTSPEKLAVRLGKSLSRLSSVLPLSDSAKLQIWKLSYRLWNACVDLSNAADVLASIDDGDRLRCRTGQAELRQIASEFLLLAGKPQGIPSPAFKSASFFHKTGLIWHSLGLLERAAANFERATDLTSSARAECEEEKRLLLDINLARSRTAWEANDRSLAIALLGRSKNILFGSPVGFQALAEQYLQFGKLSLKVSSEEAIDASKLLSEALDLCDKGILASTGATLDLEQLKARCLRFMAAERLQAEDYEGVLRCVRVLRGIEVEDHPSVGYVAMRAWIGAGRLAEAERELIGMMTNNGVPEMACVSAAEAFLAASGPEAAKGVMMMLLGRCRGGAGAALRIMRRVTESGSSSGCTGRSRLVAELAADERVVALFDGSAVAKEKNAMHALLWNLGAEHFRSKEYEISADLFEKSMLYVSLDELNRSRRSNCFRVLGLCHLALVQLDRAQEFVDQAEKLEPTIKCCILKFKILLQKEDFEAAINQIQAMVGCVDFLPEYLTLCTHEAIACQSFPVAVASLSILLNLYSPGKSMPMPEVAVLRNLITLLHRQLQVEQEILKYTQRARASMNEVGAEAFFGKGAVGARELNWFAGNTWNMGLKTGKERCYEACAEYFELAADFYNALDDQNEGKQAMVCKCLILSTAAMINSEVEKMVPLTESDVKKAGEMLHRAEKILSSISSPSTAADDQLCFLHTFNTYQLLNRSCDNDCKTQQLQLIRSFASSKSCNPHNLIQLGLFASQGRRPNPEASQFAFTTSLSSLLSSSSPDYEMISLLLRKLVGLADDGGYNVYKQAHKIIVGLKEGAYPLEEGKWLAMTSWNKSGMAVRLRQVSIARKWMSLGLELARRVLGMEKYVGAMEECFASFEKVCRGADDCSSDAAVLQL